MSADLDMLKTILAMAKEFQASQLVLSPSLHHPPLSAQAKHELIFKSQAANIKDFEKLVAVVEKAEADPLEKLGLAEEIASEAAMQLAIPDYNTSHKALHRILEVSTGNITQDTSELLRDIVTKIDEKPSLYVDDHRGYGWWVYVLSEDFEEPEKSWPKDLQDLMACARSKGCRWVLIDQDADPIEEVPIYDW